MRIRRITFQDKEQFVNLLDSISLFTHEEKSVALELLIDTQRSDDYNLYAVLSDDESFASFICFGATAMTEGTFDMYWIGTRDHCQRKGYALCLVEKMKTILSDMGARLIRIETSGKEDYDRTRNFYLTLGMQEEARIVDFYRPGDDLVIYFYRF